MAWGPVMSSALHGAAALAEKQRKLGRMWCMTWQPLRLQCIWDGGRCLRYPHACARAVRPCDCSASLGWCRCLIDPHACAGAGLAGKACGASGMVPLSHAFTCMHVHVCAGLAGELTEALRLILEPTRATRLAGDFRSGKRLAMRRVIAYIASHFRRDKIWLRRTRPDRRTYQVRRPSPAAPYGVRVLGILNSSPLACSHEASTGHLPRFCRTRHSTRC